jgi:hypothetical protein
MRYYPKEEMHLETLHLRGPYIDSLIEALETFEGVRI